MAGVYCINIFAKEGQVVASRKYSTKDKWRLIAKVIRLRYLKVQ